MAVLASLAPAGCGGAEKTVEPLLGQVDRARDAQASSSLAQALAAASLVRAESGSYGVGSDDLAQRLQARDPSKRFGTGPSTGPDQVQVVGGGADPAMLVVRSGSDAYLAAWSDGAATLYYRGGQPPAYSAQRPAAGWTESPQR